MTGQVNEPDNSLRLNIERIGCDIGGSYVGSDDRIVIAWMVVVAKFISVYSLNGNFFDSAPNVAHFKERFTVMVN